MSYASAVAHNAAPLEKQPKPDPGLLEGRPAGSPSANVSDRSIAHNAHDGRDRAEHNQSKSSEDGRKDDGSPRANKSKNADKAKEVAKSAKKEFQDPATQLTLMGVVNVVAVLGTAALAAKHWQQPHWDKRVVSGVVIGLGALLGSQGYLGALFYNAKKNS